MNRTPFVPEVDMADVGQKNPPHKKTENPNRYAERSIMPVNRLLVQYYY